MKASSIMKHLDDYETIARELGYPESVIKKLRLAQNLYERDRIMINAR